MYVFALFAIPLGFLSAVFRALTKEQRAVSYGMFAKGAIFGVPAILIHGILGFLYGPAYGSWLLVPTILLGTFLVPFTLAGGAFALSFGTDPRRQGILDLAAFAFGFMSVMAGKFAIASAGTHNHVFAFYLPVWMFAFAAYFPHLWIDALHEGFPGSLKQLALAATLLVAASFSISLAQTRHEFLAFLAFLASSAGTGFLAFGRWRKLVLPRSIESGREAEGAPPVTRV